MRLSPLPFAPLLLALPLVACSGTKDSGNDSVPVSDTDTDTDADTDTDGDTDTDTVDTAAELDASRAAFEDTLVGTWLTPCTQSPPAEDGSTSYNILEFVYGGEGAASSFSTTIYSDSACASALAGFRGTSTVAIGQPLPDVALNTWEMNTTFTKLYATAYVDQAATGFETAGCGTGSWTAGVEQDVSNTGCGPYKSVSTCPTDYDLAEVSLDLLYTGAKAADTCEVANRPTAANPWGYERQ